MDSEAEQLLRKLEELKSMPRPLAYDDYEERAQGIYAYKITFEQAMSTPMWDADESCTPPLSASDALEKARAFIADEPISSMTYWRFCEMTLTQIALIRRSVWRVEFQLTLRAFSSGVWPTARCLVMMDGTVVQPSWRLSDLYKDEQEIDT